MDIGTIIKIVDNLKPNAYPDIAKIQWLSKLDGQIAKEILATHEDNPLITEENPTGAFEGYVSDTPLDTKLLIPYPYDEDVYCFYLQAKIDQENSEINKYNQSISLYNAAISSFQNMWNREHRPIKKGMRFKF